MIASNGVCGVVTLCFTTLEVVQFQITVVILTLIVTGSSDFGAGIGPSYIFRNSGDFIDCS